MNSISDKIKSGARSFLVTEYTYLVGFVFITSISLFVLYFFKPNAGHLDGLRYAGSFVVGACLSASAGWNGMVVATDANVKTAQAADKGGLNAALNVAFTGGAVMGFMVVSLGLMGVATMYFLVGLGYSDVSESDKLKFSADALAAFGFGASSIALFARVAGGIYTKAADVGKSVSL
jgi:inorganic pyrophosphatase